MKLKIISSNWRFINDWFDEKLIEQSSQTLNIVPKTTFAGGDKTNDVLEFLTEKYGTCVSEEEIHNMVDQSIKEVVMERGICGLPYTVAHIKDGLCNFYAMDILPAQLCIQDVIKAHNCMINQYPFECFHDIYDCFWKKVKGQRFPLPGALCQRFIDEEEKLIITKTSLIIRNLNQFTDIQQEVIKILSKKIPNVYIHSEIELLGWDHLETVRDATQLQPHNLPPTQDLPDDFIFPKNCLVVFDCSLDIKGRILKNNPVFHHVHLSDELQNPDFLKFFHYCAIASYAENSNDAMPHIEYLQSINEWQLDNSEFQAIQPEKGEGQMSFFNALQEMEKNEKLLPIFNTLTQLFGILSDEGGDRQNLLSKVFIQSVINCVNFKPSNIHISMIKDFIDFDGTMLHKNTNIAQTRLQLCQLLIHNSKTTQHNIVCCELNDAKFFNSDTIVTITDKSVVDDLIKKIPLPKHKHYIYHEKP